MSSAEEPDPTERVLLAAGASSYDSAHYLPLREVPRALRDVVGALKEFGFATVAQPPGYYLDQPVARLRAALRAAAAAPVVVVYYTGHGHVLEGDTFYLVSKESQVTDLADSGLPARDLLIRFIRRSEDGEPRTDQPEVLVILDCCFSGTAGKMMLDDSLRMIGNQNVWVIASTGPAGYAQQGVFAEAFCNALRQPATGPSQRFVSLDGVVQAVNDACARAESGQKALLFPPGGSLAGIPSFFRNPLHRPGLAGLTVADQHWLSRVRGGPEDSTTGFYLSGMTGRLRAAEDLAAWMAGPELSGLAAVTGSPGTGKSALLSVPVLLAEPSWRAELLRAARCRFDHPKGGIPRLAPFPGNVDPCARPERRPGCRSHRRRAGPDGPHCRRAARRPGQHSAARPPRSPRRCGR